MVRRDENRQQPRVPLVDITDNNRIVCDGLDRSWSSDPPEYIGKRDVDVIKVFKPVSPLHGAENP